MRKNTPITPTAMSTPILRRQHQHGDQDDEQESDTHRGPRFERPPRPTGSGRCRHRDPTQVRLWRRLHSRFGRGSPSAKVGQAELVVLALPLKAGELRPEPLSLGEPGRSPFQFVPRCARFDPDCRKLALERGDRRLQL